MIALRRKREPYDNRVTALWTAARPFVENSRGLLIHRPMEVTSYKIHARMHLGVHYWCGNCSAGGNNFAFLDQPPSGKLLCETCDRRAIMSGLPSAAEIVGSHVHLGRVYARQTCCGGDQ